MRSNPADTSSRSGTLKCTPRRRGEAAQGRPRPQLGGHALERTLDRWATRSIATVGRPALVASSRAPAASMRWARRRTEAIAQTIEEEVLHGGRSSSVSRARPTRPARLGCEGDLSSSGTPADRVRALGRPATAADGRARSGRRWGVKPYSALFGTLKVADEVEVYRREATKESRRWLSWTIPFKTGKPTDYNWEAILDLDRVIPCVEGGRVVERTARVGQGRDHGEDGCDVDDVHGGPSRSSSGTRPSTARCCG